MIIAQNKSFSGTDKRYHGILASTSWTLCVGAGISAGLVPTWQELTRSVVNSAFGTNYDASGFEDVVAQTRWGLDALLQGAANRLLLDGKSSDDFDIVLEDAIYGNLLKNAGSAGVSDALIDALNNPRWLNSNDLERLCSFFLTSYPESTLVQLSQELARANEAQRGPRSVINFNADTLLYALVDSFLIREHRKRTGKTDYPPALFVRSFRSNETFDKNAIPIFHCHGALTPLPKKKTKSGKRRDSRDHLVFLEQDYLDLAGSVSTWAQSLFLFHAQNHRLVIAGHSLADPNIRRWLGWTNATSMKDLSAVSLATQATPKHLWITKTHTSAKLKEIQETSLLHLGVRVCWIDDWREIGATLRNLLAI